MNTGFARIGQLFKSAIADKYGDGIPATIGRADGTVRASKPGFVYAVIDSSGQVVEAYNPNVAPNKYNTKVMIGFKKGSARVFQILRTRNVWEKLADYLIPNHSETHTFPKEDTVWIMQEQIIPLMVQPTTGMNVKVYGATLLWMDGAKYVTIRSTTLDLSSHIPVHQSRYVLIQAHDDGTITVKDGTPVITPELLGIDDIPLPDTNCLQLAAVRLYDGQTSVSRNSQVNDFVELRLYTGSGGGGSLPTLDPDRVVTTDASGNIQSVDWLRYDNTTHAFVVGNHVPIFGRAGDVEQFAPDGENASNIKWAFGGYPSEVTFVADGTEASKTAVTAGQILHTKTLFAYDGTDYYDAGKLRMVASENWDATHHGTKWELWVVPDGSTTLTLALTINANGTINIPTGKTYTVNGVEYVSAKLGDAIHSATGKTTPVDADELALWDSVSSAIKKLTWGNLKATLKTYFDGLYSAIGHTHSYAPVSSQYVTLATDETLTNERVLTVGVNLSKTDGGAGGAVTLNVSTQSATVFHNATQSISSATWTTIALNDEVSDPQGWHNPVTNNSRINVPSGEYQVIIQNMSFASNATGVRGVLVRDSDGNQWGQNIVPALSGIDTPVTLVVQRTISGSGKYIYVQVYQTSGAALNLNAYIKVTVNRLS
jgi:hypothetical protein